MPQVDVLIFAHKFFMAFTLFTTYLIFMPAKLIPSQNKLSSGHWCVSILAVFSCYSSASPALPPKSSLDERQRCFFFFFFFSFFLSFFIYLFMAVLGLRFCARAFSSCGKRGPLFIAVRGPLTIAASLVAEHKLQTRRLSNCGSRAKPLRGMWDLPRPRLEPVSPALAGGFSTTAPPGKPQRCFLNSALRSIGELWSAPYCKDFWRTEGWK